MGTKKTAKYNQPFQVSERYGRGDRRWSFFIGREKQEYKTESPQFRRIIAEEIGGGYGNGVVQILYSCDCPDFQREQVAQPQFDVPDITAKYGVPRVFEAGAIKHYLSNYTRYMRGLQLFSKVQFVEQIGSQYTYKIPTTRADKFTRDWSSSDAGIYPNYCKHIWAVILYRGDTYTTPDDVPDIALDRDIELPSKWKGQNMF